jgi:hypothetical protein
MIFFVSENFQSFRHQIKAAVLIRLSVYGDGQISHTQGKSNAGNQIVSVF